ncbi:hypothetical protein HFN72_34130, partial [Rhizobium laguerreae]|uniref:hypothetical protein n=1 Tax=Rhizobium laguerreae TaxID=1076926 RepID=UPI001C90E4EC
DVMRCCAAEMAPHRNPPLPNQQQQPKTAGANSKLDKTWGQGQNSQIDDLLRWAYAAKHELKAVAWKQRLHFGALYA